MGVVEGGCPPAKLRAADDYRVTVARRPFWGRNGLSRANSLVCRLQHWRVVESSRYSVVSIRGGFGYFMSLVGRQRQVRGR